MNMKDILKELEKWPLTIITIILTPVLYLGITSFTIRGILGTTLFMGVMILGLEYLIKVKICFCFSRFYSRLLILTASGYAVLALAAPKIGYLQLVICILIMALILIVLFSIWKECTALPAKFMAIMIFISLVLSLSRFVVYLGYFTADSYSYYEISQTILNDFGNVGTMRQYVVDSNYNCSFPYLYPLMVWILDGITGLGIYAGSLLNLVIMLYTGVLLVLISKKICRRRGPGVISMCLLFTNVFYLEEVYAARSIPATLMLTVLCIYLCTDMFFHNKNKMHNALIIGGLCGAVTALRFDGIALFAFCALIMVLILPGKRFQRLICYLAGGMFFLLPWVIYSWKHFGTIWISDNSGTMFLVETVIPNTVSVSGDTVKTLFNAPGKWFRALLGKTEGGLISMAKCQIGSWIVLLAGLWGIKRKITDIKGFAAENKKALTALAVVFLFYIAKTGMYIIVGYDEARYHIEMTTVLVLAVLMFLAVLYSRQEREGFKAAECSILGIVCAISIAVSFGALGAMHYYAGGIFSFPLSRITVAPGWITTLEDELHSNHIALEEEILFLRNGFVFGGWSDRRVLVEPDNLSWETVSYLVNTRMKKGYVAVPKDTKEYKRTKEIEEIDEKLQAQYESIELTNYILYDLQKEK